MALPSGVSEFGQDRRQVVGEGFNGRIVEDDGRGERLTEGLAEVAAQA